MKYEEVYESFKGYRERRTASREAFVTKQQHKFVKAIESLGLKSSLEENAKRENANVDGDGPMGTMLHFGSTISKEFAKAYLMEKKYAKAHDEGAIHIHDLTFICAAFIPFGNTNNPIIFNYHRCWTIRNRYS